MELKYLIKEPEKINPETPLLVMIHGYGSNEEDLFSLSEDLPKNFIIVSFRAPRDTFYGGYSWYDIDFSDAEKFINAEQAEESINFILVNIEKIKQRFHLSGKVHLMGFSQGGILSYSLSLSFPELFHKVAILSAYPEKKILKNISEDKKSLSEMRFFISHGLQDSTIPIEWGKQAVDILYDLGCFFSFNEYSSGHGINQKNYTDLMRFFSDCGGANLNL